MALKNLMQRHLLLRTRLWLKITFLRKRITVGERKFIRDDNIGIFFYFFSETVVVPGKSGYLVT